MGNVVDTRVVEMQFDNAQFEKNIDSSVNSLENLNKSLDLDNAASKFSFAAEIITGALRRLGENIMDVGVNLAKAVTLDPIISGLKSYEEQIGAVQVIMNATGRSIADVEKNMDQLVWFADETSYSMDQMSSAVGRFVSNNVKLEDSVTAIQGVANMAALAGVSGYKAAIAFNNFADAIGKGGLSAIDYKSLELANITTTEFKQTAIEAAIAVGQLGSSGEILTGKMKGTVVTIENFKETLSDQASGMWFSNEVIMAQTQRFGDYTTAVYEKATELGISCAEAMKLVSVEGMALGAKAFRAAQEAKTLTDVINYTRDALSSGWATSWKLITGNYEESKVLFSGLAELLYQVVVSGGEARNAMLLFWKEQGGRQAFLEGLDYLVRNLKMIIGPIKDAFREIFPAKTGEDLVRISNAFRELMRSFTMSEESSENLKNTFKGLFAVIDIGRMAISELIKFVGKVINVFQPATSGVLGLTGGLGEFLSKIRDAIKDGNLFGKALDVVVQIISTLVHVLSPVATGLKSLFLGLIGGADDVGKSFKNIFSGDGGSSTFVEKVIFVFSKLFEFLGKGLSALPGLFSGAIKKIQEFAGVDAGAGIIATLKGVLANLPTLGEIATSVKNFVSNIGTSLGKLSPIFVKIWEIVGPILNVLYESLKKVFVDMDLEKALSIINQILQVGLLKTLLNLTGAFGDFIEGSAKIVTSVSKVLDGVAKSLKAFAFSVKAKAIKDIAIAIAILTASLIALSFVDPDKILKSLGILTVLMAELMASMFALSKIEKVSFKSVLSMGVAFIGLSAGVLMLASALKKLAAISWADLGKGLLAVTVLMAELVIAAQLLGKNAGGLGKVGIGFLGLAGGLLLMIKAIEAYANIDTDILVAGLIALGATILTLGIAISKFPKNTPAIAAGLLLLSVSLLAIAGVILLYSKFSFETLVSGLLAMAATLVTLGLSLKVLTPGLKQVATILLLAVAITALTVPLLILSTLSLGDIAKGLITIAGTFAILAVASKALKGDVKVLTSFGIALLAFAAGFKVLSMVMDDMDLGLFAKTMLAVASATLMMTVLSKAGGNAKGAMKTAVSMLVVFGGVALVLQLMATFSDVEKIEKVAVALTATMVAMAGVLFAISKIDDKNVSKNIKTLGMIVLLTIPLAAVIVGMSLLGNAEDMIPAAVSVGLLMAALSASLLILAKVNEEQAKKAVDALGKLSIFTAVSAAILIAMSRFSNAAALIPAAVSLGLLMNALGAAVLILGNVNADKAKEAVGTLGILSTFTIITGTVLTAMSALLNENDVGALIPSAIALGLLMNELAITVGILGMVDGKKAEQGLKSLAIISLITAALGVVIGWIATWTNADAMIPIAVSMGLLMIELGIATNIITRIPAGSAIGPMKSLAIVAGGMVVILGILGAIGSIPGVTWLLDKGVEVLGSIGEGIGAFIGGIIGGIIGGAITAFSNSLPGLGQALSDFMDNSQGFIDGAKKVDKTVLEGVTLLAGAMLVLIAGDLVTSIYEFLSGKINFKDLQETIGGMADSLLVFAQKTDGLDADKVKIAAEAMLVLFKAFAKIPNEGGIISAFTGDNKPSVFGPEMEVFGDSLKAFDEAVQGVDAENLKIIANAALTLFNAFKEIPNSGGMVSGFTGDNKPSVFGPEMEVFGESLKAFDEAVQGVDAENLKIIANAALTLFNAFKEIPNSGGMVSGFSGDNKPSVFGPEMEVFGDSLKAFDDAVKGVDAENLKIIANAALTLFNAFKEIPNEGGMISDFTGDNKPSVFGPEMATFGNYLRDFDYYVKDVDGAKIEEIANASLALFQAFEKIPNSGGLISGFTGDNKPSVFGPEMEVFGENINAFGKSVEGLPTQDIEKAAETVDFLFTKLSEMPNVYPTLLSGLTVPIVDLGKALSDYAGYMTSQVNSAIMYSVSTVLNLIDIVEKLKGTDIAGVISHIYEQIKAALNDPGLQTTPAITMDGLVDQIVQSIAKNAIQFTMASKAILKAMSDGITISDPAGPVIKMEAILKAMLDKFKTTEFESIGKYVNLSLVSGMASESRSVYDEAWKIGRAMVDGLRDATGIHSISPEYWAIGYYTNVSIRSGMDSAAEQPVEASKETGRNMLDQYRGYLPDWAQAGIDSATSLVSGVTDGFDDFDTDRYFSNFVNESVIPSADAALGDGSNFQTQMRSTGGGAMRSLGAGMSEEKTPEQIAEEKAKKIVEAFSKGLSSLSTVLQTISLEFQLFEAQLGYIDPEDKLAVAARNAELITAKLESANRRLEVQTNQVALAQEEYNQMIAEFGEESDYARESLNKLLQLQIDVANTLNEIGDLQRGQTDAQKTTREENLNAQNRYYEDLKNLYEDEKALEALYRSGFTDEEIQAGLRERAGYNPQQLRQTSQAAVETSVVNSMDAVAETYSENVSASLAPLAQQYGEAGSLFASSMGKGMVLATPAVREISAKVAWAGVEQASKSALAWVEVGKSAAQGFADGMIKNIDLVIAAGGALAQAAIAAAMKILMSASPSRAFYELGMYSDMGYANAMKDYTYLAEDAAGNLAQTSIDSLRDALTKAANMVNTIGDVTPTIRPVIDLSNVQTGIELMNNMLNKTMSFGLSAQKAKSISDYREEQFAANQNGRVIGAEGAVIKFEQNNYSPKALSQVDIYRQTKNQFSTLKGLVSAR